MKDLVEPDDKENANSEHSQWRFKDNASLEQIAEKGYASWKTLLRFLDEEGGSDPILWTTDNCILFAQADAPPQHGYTLELQVMCPETSVSRRFKISAETPQAAASTVSGILSLMISEPVTEPNLGITFKCFATQPRQVFPYITPGVREKLRESIVFASVSLQFVALDAEICHTFANASREIELRQCSVHGGLGPALAITNSDSTAIRMTKLTLSCAMPEFSGLSQVRECGGSGFLDSPDCSLQELYLVLHFWLQGDAFCSFTKALKSNKSLRYLSIKFLDISDNGWMELFQALKGHPTIQNVNLCFTDNFVDNYRRLTPERRKDRCQAVLDMIQANPVVQDVSWPEFQQDESLMVSIRACLERNKLNDN